MVDEAADQDVRHQTAGGNAAVDQLRHGRCLLQGLAAAAHPLAVDVPVHEELGRHDVQPLADVFADARHRPAAAGRCAIGALGLVVMLDAAQMRGQRLTPRLAWWRLGLGVRIGSRRLASQQLQLFAQAGLVLGQRLFEQATLLGVHGFGLGAELPALESRQLQGDLLDLGLAQRQLAVLALQQVLAAGQFLIALGKDLLTLGQLLRLGLHALLQLRDQCCRTRGQVLQIQRRKITHAKHAWHRARRAQQVTSGDAPSTNRHDALRPV